MGKQRGDRFAKKQAAQSKGSAKAADRAAKDGAKAAERDARARAQEEQRQMIEQGLDDLDVLETEQRRLEELQEQAAKSAPNGMAAPLNGAYGSEQVCCVRAPFGI